MKHDLIIPSVLGAICIVGSAIGQVSAPACWAYGPDAWTCDNVDFQQVPCPALMRENNLCRPISQGAGKTHFEEDTRSCVYQLREFRPGPPSYCFSDGITTNVNRQCPRLTGASCRGGGGEQ